MRKRSAATFFAVLAVFFVTVCLLVGTLWWYGRNETGVDLGREYYFLVQDCEDTTASAVAGQVYLAGGAGYLLGDAVVLSCYFARQDAERVQSSLKEKGVETRILALSSERLSLHGRDAALGASVRSNLETAETCARVLFDTANGLERASLSQESARAAVKGAVTTLSGLERSNEAKLFDRWNAALREMERRGTEIASGILFAKDLRYLQTELLLAVVHADDYF